jgi:hypothetical protein
MARRRIALPELLGPAPSDKALSRVRCTEQQIRDAVTGSVPPELRPEFWRQFMRMPMANCACQLLSLMEPDNTREAGLYRRKCRRPAGTDLFDDIPLAERARAKEIYAKLCERHSERLPSCRWLRPVLAGRARWLATHPDGHGSEWGRKMLRIKGGKHAQQRYRELGWSPLASVRKANGWPAERPQ